MGTKTVHICDVCGDEPKDDDLSTWRRVTISHMAPTIPAVEVPGVAPTPAPTVEHALICHKPSCLTKWSKDQNESKP